MTTTLHRTDTFLKRAVINELLWATDVDSVRIGVAVSGGAVTLSGEVKTYPEGHFAIYVDDAFERVVADQLAFLDKHLKPAIGSE